MRSANDKVKSGWTGDDGYGDEFYNVGAGVFGCGVAADEFSDFGLEYNEGRSNRSIGIWESRNCCNSSVNSVKM
jgi:hypothetical protein